MKKLIDNTKRKKSKEKDRYVITYLHEFYNFQFIRIARQ